MMSNDMHRKPEEHKRVQSCLSKQRAGRCHKHIEAVTLRKFNQILSRDNPKQTFCSLSNRSTNAPQPKKLLTNFYNVSVEPFKNRKGDLGSVMGKAERFPSKLKPINTRKPLIIKHEKKRPPPNISTLPLNKIIPNLLLQDSTRSINPDEPGPMSYYHKGHEISQAISPPIKSRRIRPHVFLKNSSVPAKLNVIHRRHTSFEPGPGRYDTWHRKLCPCPQGKFLCDHLQLLIDRENIHKFRLQHYQKIDKNIFCDADLRHIPGGGFTHLFKSATDYKVPRVPTLSQTNLIRHETFISGRYRKFVNDPKRLSLLPPANDLKRPPPNIRFNTDVKIFRRRQRQTKIPFGCRQPRFSGDEIKRPKIEKPRPHFIYQPIKRIRLPLVQSRLLEIPFHRKQTRPTIKRRRMFRFEPISEPKSLISADDYKIIFHSDGVLYNKSLKIESFFKTNMTDLTLSRIKLVIPNTSRYSLL